MPYDSLLLEYTIFIESYLDMDTNKREPKVDTNVWKRRSLQEREAIESRAIFYALGAGKSMLPWCNRTET